MIKLQRKVVFTNVKKIVTLVMSILILVLFTACAKEISNEVETTKNNKTDGQESELTSDSSQNKQEIDMKDSNFTYKTQFEMPIEGEEVAIMTTNYGVIKMRLFEEIAPKAVENFKTHSKNGYYNGLVFHRVIKDFMIQGGDPEGTGRGGQSIYGEAFEDEFDPRTLPYRGALCMANAGPNTNGSQFFIVQLGKGDENIAKQMEEGGFPKEIIDNYLAYGGTPWLFMKHTTFGQVYEGIDVVDAIANVATGKNDRPSEDVIIEKIEIVNYK